MSWHILLIVSVALSVWYCLLSFPVHARLNRYSERVLAAVCPSLPCLLFPYSTFCIPQERQYRYKMRNIIVIEAGSVLHLLVMCCFFGDDNKYRYLFNSSEVCTSSRHSIVSTSEVHDIKYQYNVASLFFAKLIYYDLPPSLPNLFIYLIRLSL